MTSRRRFERQPQIGANSRAAGRSIPGMVSPDVQKFKNTYVHERRFLERFRAGSETQAYKPSPSLDGQSRFDTPEEKPGKNQWDETYRKLKAMQRHTPSQYVRVLFKVLRGSSLAIPTLAQLASPKVLGLVEDHYKDLNLELRQNFVAESQRARSAITISQKGVGHPLGLAVYYAIVDSRLELSPLFKYCLARSTSSRIRQNGEQNAYCEKLDRLAKQYEFEAAMEYTLFPDLYDTVWGPMIPSGFRVAASSLLETAIEQ